MRVTAGKRWRAVRHSCLLGGVLLSTAARAAPPALPESGCRPLPQAERWLAMQAPRWASTLAPLAGYEAPEGIAVCDTTAARPYADYGSNRIYLRRISPEEDRITLAHEYIHLAFGHHPSSRDEAFVETTARRLLEEHP